MKNNKSGIMILSVTLLLLPGCGGNLVDWGKDTFPQAKKERRDTKDIKQYIKQINLYDQLNTIGLFDVMWLSDEIRRYYAETYSRIAGKTSEQTKTMLRRLFKANSQGISFYLLAPNRIELAVKPIEWGLYLEVDGVNYQPVQVKKVELPFLYRPLFEARYSPHKQPYEVKFDRRDVNGKDILQHDIPHVMKFVVANLHYTGKATFPVSTLTENESARIVLETQFEKHEKEQQQEVLKEEIRVSNPQLKTDMKQDAAQKCDVAVDASITVK